MRVAQLTISSFRGWSIGAEHWYGKIDYSPPFERKWSSNDPRNKRFEVERKMTKAEAEVLTDKDGFVWHEGDPTTRFDTVEQVCEAAIPIFEEHFDKDEDILIAGLDIGDRWTHDRLRRVVTGKPGIVKQFEGLEPEEAEKLSKEIGIDAMIGNYI